MNQNDKHYRHLQSINEKKKQNKTTKLINNNHKNNEQSKTKQKKKLHLQMGNPSTERERARKPHKSELEK